MKIRTSGLKAAEEESTHAHALLAMTKLEALFLPEYLTEEVARALAAAPSYLHWPSSMYLPALLPLLGLTAAASGELSASQGDPCAAIAGKDFVPPTEALACLKSFPFNETLRQNVLTVVSRVFDFFTFENFYLHSPPPFQDSTNNIRANLSRINSTEYAVCSPFKAGISNLITL